MKITELKKLNDAAEQIVKELASRNIRIADLDTVFEMVKEKANRMTIVISEDQKSNEALLNSIQNKIVEILDSELETI